MIVMISDINEYNTKYISLGIAEVEYIPYDKSCPSTFPFLMPLLVQRNECWRPFYNKMIECFHNEPFFEVCLDVEWQKCLPFTQG